MTVDTNAKTKYSLTLNRTAVSQSHMEASPLATASVVCRTCAPHEISTQHNGILKSHELSVWYFTQVPWDWGYPWDVTIWGLDTAAVSTLFPGESFSASLMFVVYHASKFGGRLDNGPVCGPNSFMVEVTSCKVTLVQHGAGFLQSEPGRFSGCSTTLHSLVVWEGRDQFTK